MALRRFISRLAALPLSGEALQALTKQSCSAVGAHVQGDRAARDKAAQAILAFFRKTLGSR